MRWLFKLAIFKAYHAFAAVLMIVLTWYSARLFGHDGNMPILWIILSPIVVWISLSIFPGSVRKLESMGDPLAWPRDAWVAILCFLSITLMTITPMLRYRNYPSFYLFAGLAAEIAVTAGMAAYLYLVWSSRRLSENTVESLKLEHQAWVVVFSSTVLWVGTFIVGVYLTGVKDGQASVTAGQLDATSAKELVIISWSLALYSIVGSIMWMLRPVFQRLYLLSVIVAEVEKAEKY